MKFCIDCEHATRKSDGYGVNGIWQCMHPKITKIDLVSGRAIFRDCEDMRADMTCGPDALLFEEKKKALRIGHPRRVGTFWSRLFKWPVGA